MESVSKGAEMSLRQNCSEGWVHPVEVLLGAWECILAGSAMDYWELVLRSKWQYKLQLSI